MHYSIISTNNNKIQNNALFMGHLCNKTSMNIYSQEFNIHME